MFNTINTIRGIAFRSTEMSVHDGRKIPREYENPIDNVLIDITHSLNPTYKKLGITPNILTTFSWVCAIVGLWLFKKAPKGSHHVYIGVILYFMGYFFDCADGNMARTYRMTTIFGDKYDHYTDMITTIFVYYVLFKVTPKKYRVLCAVIIVVLTGLTIVQLGCQERIYHTSQSNNESPFLESSKLLCRGDISTVGDMIKYTRFFGCGTLMVAVCMIMLRMKAS